jgi:hypothetical protein
VIEKTVYTQLTMSRPSVDFILPLRECIPPSTTQSAPAYPTSFTFSHQAHCWNHYSYCTFLCCNLFNQTGSVSLSTSTCRLRAVLMQTAGPVRGANLEASMKAAPHVPVFAAMSPQPHHCTCGCVVPALARTPLLLNLTACTRVICMLAVASGSSGCSGGVAMAVKIYNL